MGELWPSCLHSFCGLPTGEESALTALNKRRGAAWSGAHRCSGLARRRGRKWGPVTHDASCSSDVVWSDESFFRLQEQPIRTRGSVWVCFVSQVSFSSSQFLVLAGYCREFHCSHHECEVLLFNAFLVVFQLFLFQVTSLSAYRS